MKIDPEFQRLIPPLQEQERMQLEENLVANGCRDPLVLWRGVLIDGHNRYAICTRLKIKFRTVEITLPSREHVFLWIEENQLGRRNLPELQRACIAESVLERRRKINLIERARKGRARGGDATAEQKAERRNRLPEDVSGKRSHDRSKESRRAVSKSARVSEWLLRQVGEIKKKSTEAFEKMRSGEKTLQQVRKDLRKQEREQRIEEAAKIAQTAPPDDRCVLLHCDLAEADIAPESIDVIITDPPYEKDALPALNKLAALAARTLKPNGSLFVMIGQLYLPDVLQTLATNGLVFHWTVAYLLPGGQAARIWPRKVIQYWKPVLWFVKGEYCGEWVSDVIKSAPNNNDKRFHEWGQSESGMAELVERFSLPGQIILDPFLGAGTTGVVALQMGRKFIGVDADINALQMAQARLMKGNEYVAAGDDSQAMADLFDVAPN
jgi:16S rRNA G966 N2-methylase RsmD